MSDSRPRPAVGLVAARAVRQKLRAVASLGTFWPAVARGGRLLARGRVREFARKLFNEAATVRAAGEAPVREGPPLVLAGHALRPGGYDHVVLAVLDGLLSAGVNVVRDPLAVLNLDLIPLDRRPGEHPRPGGLPRLAACPPHLLSRFRPDRRTAAFTMWETDTLPPAAVRALNRCGLVVVPSRWGAECFRANGVAVPIEVVPLGYDPDIFRRTERESEGVCTFGTAGALDAGGLRKNVPRVADLFRRAFPAEADVRLRVKVTPSSPMVETHGDPRIEVVRRSLPPDELAGWYRSLTVFVNGSFGEGFGLHLLEAMACGVPLISTAFGGVGSLFDERVGYAVPYRLVEARNAVYAGRWADPDDGAVMAALRRVYADREEAGRLGALAAERAAGFTWAATARGLADALARHGFLPAGMAGPAGVV
ncbi:MAG: glycosyltransferase family 4 protein [Gemmataceae bacterium]|nr:glycosyltransferase family 4 protein [Gemmataceae bacterium]